MNASFSKESLSSWIQQEISTPMRSGPLSPSRSELWTKITNSSSQTIGNPVLEPDSANGELPLPPPSGAKSVSSTSLLSKAVPEKIIESLPPQRKVIAISRSDFVYLTKIIENYKIQVEKSAREL
jgi:hypothetical protein